MIVVDRSTMIRDGFCLLLAVGIRFDYCNECHSHPLNLFTKKTLFTPPKPAIIDTVHTRPGCMPMILSTRHNYSKFPMVKAVVCDRPLYTRHC